MGKKTRAAKAAERVNHPIDLGETAPAATWEPVDSIVGWKGNPRLNSEAIEPVARSILRFGFGNPILARKANREAIAGHTRIAALAFLAENAFDHDAGRWRRRTEEDGPFLVRGAPGPGLAPVRFMDLSEHDAHALALADNRLGEIAEWDEKLLTAALEELSDGGIDLDGLGWSSKELDEFLAEPDPEPPPAAPPEPPPLPPGRATIHRGRCEEVMRTFADESFDSAVCDPPYGLSEGLDEEEARSLLAAWTSGQPWRGRERGFMDREWDAFVPGPDVWREVFRVLKPGAHVIAFAGTRTEFWLTLALQLAGFEIRDVGQWVYWSGFPKSVDVAGAIDRSRRDEADVRRLCEWLRGATKRAGWTNRKIDALFETKGMGAHWTAGPDNLQPAAMQPADFDRLVAAMAVEVPPEIRALVVDLEERKGKPGERWAEREVIGTARMMEHGAMGSAVFGREGEVREVELTAPTAEALPFAGLGTALKPTMEPWVLARKPLGRKDGKSRTVAACVQEFGTGALNIDACRFREGDPMWPGPNKGLPSNHGESGASEPTSYALGEREPMQTAGQQIGRWPANLVHVPKPSRKEREAGCLHLPPRTAGEATARKDGSAGLESPRAGAGRSASDIRNHHPTLKPIRLMAWLARLATPRGGRILDPFAGSGTCGASAVPQGYSYDGIEVDPAYARIAEARVAHWASVGLGELPVWEEPEDLDEDQPDRSNA